MTTDRSGEFLDALGALSRRRAVEVVTGARAAGDAVALMVDEIFSPAQREVGLRWERDEWSVAREHAATVIAELALSAVSDEGAPPVRGSLVAACVSGEWHSFPARLMAESLRDLDWAVTCLGGSVPPDHLEAFLREHRPDALLLSVTLAGNLPGALDSVTAARSAGVPVVLGGAAVDAYPSAAGAVGAHRGPADPHEVHDLVEQLLGEPPLPPAVDAAAAQRCNDVRAVRRSLVAAVADGVPALPGGADSLVGPLVDSLAAAALLESPAPLQDFAGWLAGVLRARGRDGRAVDDLLDVLARETAHRVPALAGLVESGAGHG